MYYTSIKYPFLQKKCRNIYSFSFFRAVFHHNICIIKIRTKFSILIKCEIHCYIIFINYRLQNIKLPTKINYPNVYLLPYIDCH